MELETERFVLEKKELETVLESGIFAASSNAAKLLRFVCDRHFRNADDTITETDVAIQALGRRADFDPQRDSIVRVEAHRVRKRLQEYYEHEGATHPTRIVLTRGHYAPRFVHAESPVQPMPATPAADEPEVRSPTRWKLMVLGAAGAALLVGLVWRASSSHNVARVRSIVAAPVVSGDVVRLLAGLDSGDYIDRDGTRWSHDAYYDGGTAAPVRYYSLALADDPAIYQHVRMGENFGYDIPLKPGVYEMRLMFAESAEVAIVGTVGEGARSFHVLANGAQLLPPPDGRHMHELDVVADAGGSNTADVKVFKDISPAADGKLHLRFIGRNQRAMVNAIEIVPGEEGRMHILRWRASDTPYTDHDGKAWLSDRYYRGGRLSRFHAVVGHTSDPGLYEGERFGAFSYSIPVAAGTSYTVHLNFAENYFGGWAAKGASPRIFSVFANHAGLLRDFNVSQEAGGSVTALTKLFRGVKPNTFDKIVLSFEPVNEFAIVNAIEVEDEAR